MEHGQSPTLKRVPWYLWPLVPPVFLATLIFVGIPLGLLALLSIPYFWLYPDRHAHQWDFEGAGREKERLHRWRSAYQRIPFVARVRRAIKRSRRRGRRRAT